MLPVFSYRSLLGILIGLIVGALLGMGYYLSQNYVEFKAAWPPIHFQNGDQTSAYATSIQGRVMPLTIDETFVKNMDSMEQYYAARLGSLDFYQFFTNAIADQYPQYSHTPEELSTMVTVSYVTLANNPSVIDIQAQSPDDQESLFLVQALPQAFEQYLLNESNQLQGEQYQQKLDQAEIIRSALLQAGQDLTNATIPEETSPITLTPEYLQLSSRITSLENELNSQAKQAASLLAQGIIPAESQPAVVSGTSLNDSSTLALNTRMKALEEALSIRARQAVGFTLAPDASTSSLSNTAIYQSYQDASSQIYLNTIKAMELSSTELSKAKIEMSKLQSQINQQKIAVSNANEQKSLDYTLALSRITSLTKSLDALTQEIQISSPTVPDSQIPEFFISATPLSPVPINTGWKAPVVGALLGIICGWLIVNRRWLSGGIAIPETISPEKGKMANVNTSDNS